MLSIKGGRRGSTPPQLQLRGGQGWGRRVRVLLFYLRIVSVVCFVKFVCFLLNRLRAFCVVGGRRFVEGVGWFGLARWRVVQALQ